MLCAATVVMTLWAGGGLTAARGHAKGVFSGPLSARVVAVHDGDTLTVQARIWLDQDVMVHVRIAGVDTPELRGKCREEKERAIIARDTLVKWIGMGTVIIRNLRYGKYAGRVIATVILPDGRNAAKALIAANLGRAYGGGKRKGWC